MESPLKPLGPAHFASRRIWLGPPPLPSPVLPEGLADLCTFSASRETLIVGDLFSPRPFAPLSKSFVFNTVTNPLQNPPLPNSFIFHHLQTSTPLSPCVFYHLRKTSLRPQKRPQCFLSLTSHLSHKYLCFLSLTKKGRNYILDKPTLI
jgi:hypothetical protein